MNRPVMIALAAAALAAGTAAAQPLRLNARQADGVTAGALTLNVATLAASMASVAATLPVPLSDTLSVSQVHNVTINVDAVLPPAVVQHPTE